MVWCANYTPALAVGSASFSVSFGLVSDEKGTFLDENNAYLIFFCQICTL
jgi:hypothetical protein